MILLYGSRTLEDAILYCKDKIFMDIEIKEEGYEDEIVDIILKHFKPECLKRLLCELNATLVFSEKSWEFSQIVALLFSYPSKISLLSCEYNMNLS